MDGQIENLRMRKQLLALCGLLLFLPNWMQAKPIDQTINDFVQPITDFVAAIVFVAFRFSVGGQSVEVPIVLVILIGGGLYFTLHFRFPNVRYFFTSFSIIRGKYNEPNEVGEVTHFQAFTAALSGTVGLGNIAMVAVAIAIGGPGATFWMIIAGLLGMTLKFVECTLGVKYREVTDAGIVYGGPMFYLSKGFANMRMLIAGKEYHFGRIGKTLAVLFSISCVLGSLGGGNMVQINQSFKQLNETVALDVHAGEGETLLGKEVFPKENTSEAYEVAALGAAGGGAAGAVTLQHVASGEKVYLSTLELESGYVTKPLNHLGWAVGIVFAVLVGVVIIGGIRSIARVTDKLVPFMCGIYVLAGLFVIAVNIQEVPEAIGKIVRMAFGYKQIAGGMVGVLIVGFRRAAFSNEAGVGSASIAHSAVKTNYPASEGLVALLGPFIDTVLICTMTALVIVISGKYEGASLNDGIATTSSAFSTVIDWFPQLLLLAVILFAFSTMISWSYYGMQAWAYLFGRSKATDLLYKGIFCALVVVGATTDLKPLMDFSDACAFLMLFPNMVGLIFLAPVVRHELKVYLAHIRKVGSLAKEQV